MTVQQYHDPAAWARGIVSGPTINQAVPVAASFVGPSGALIGMTVEVVVFVPLRDQAFPPRTAWANIQ